MNSSAPSNLGANDTDLENWANDVYDIGIFYPDFEDVRSTLVSARTLFNPVSLLTMVTSTQEENLEVNQDMTSRSADAQRKLTWMREVTSSGIVRQALLPPHAGGPPVVQHISRSTATPETNRSHSTAVATQGAHAQRIREMNVPSYASSSWLQGPLRDCAQSSNDDGALARKLLDAGVDTEEMDRFGRRPLHWAALRGNIAVCLALLDAGADVSARDRSGKTPLHHTKDVAIVEALLDRRRHLPQTPFSNLDWPAIVDARNVYGSTALHRTAFHGREDCLLALLNGGANVAVAGKSGRNALHLACRKAHATCVKILLRWGADESAKAFDGATPWSELAIAAEEKGPSHPGVVETARLLNNARATRSWGRRGWLLMLVGARNRLLDQGMEAKLAMQLGEDGSSSTANGRVSRRVTHGGVEAAVGSNDIQGKGKGGEGDLRESVCRLLGIGETGCIRLVVSFI